MHWYMLFGALACFFAGYAAGAFGVRNELEGRDEQIRTLNTYNRELLNENIRLKAPLVEAPSRRSTGKPIPESLKVVRSKPRAT